MKFRKVFFPAAVGVDLSPQAPGIIKADFLESTALNLRLMPSRFVVTVGNPPFGKNSSLAVKFFNKCAEYSCIIAFIVPKTFRKSSLQNRLNRSFRLISDTDIESNSFVFNGVEYNVPCCFQIWEASSKVRPLRNTKITHRWLKFTDAKKADFAIRRVGSRAGRIETKSLSRLSKSTHYFISSLNQILLKTIRRIDFSVVRDQTVGVRSISKREIIDLLFKEIKRMRLRQRAKP